MLRMLVVPLALAFVGSALAADKARDTKKLLKRVAATAIDAKRPKANKDALRRLMAYRALCGVPWQSLKLDDDMTRAAQAATDLFKRTGDRTHNPTNPGWPLERFELAALGARKSNIGGTASSRMDLVEGVDRWIQDRGAKNEREVGHRAWCLNPRMAKTGFGITGGFRAMWAQDISAKDKVEIITYPPAQMPLDMFRGRFDLWELGPVPWSIHLDDSYGVTADSEVTVEVRVGRKQLIETTFVNVLPKEEAGRSARIVFRIDTRLRRKKTYRVTVKGLKKPIAYEVRFS